MRKLVDWLIGGNLDRLLKALGGRVMLETFCLSVLGSGGVAGIFLL